MLCNHKSWFNTSCFCGTEAFWDFCDVLGYFSVKLGLSGGFWDAVRNCELLWEYYKICDALGDFCGFANEVLVGLLVSQLSLRVSSRHLPWSPRQALVLTIKFLFVFPLPRIPCCIPSNPYHPPHNPYLLAINHRSAPKNVLKNWARSQNLAFTGSGAPISPQLYYHGF